MSFVFPKEGDGVYGSSVDTRSLAAGDVLVLEPNGAGELRALNGAGFVFCFFSIFPEHIFPLFSSNEMRLLQNMTQSFKGPRLHGCNTGLAQHCHGLLAELPALPHLERRGQLIRVAGAILEAELTTTQLHLPGFVRAEEHLLQVLQTLSVDDLLNLSVGELSAKFGWSQRHLNRMFHFYFGLSAAAMKMEMRLLRAVSLLRDPDVKVINVAEQCGFNYLGFFNACFKKRFGVTPSQHRKMLAEADSQSIQLDPPDNGLHCPLRSLGLACQWVERTRPQRPGPARSAESDPRGTLNLVINPPSRSSQPAALIGELRKNLTVNLTAEAS